MPRGRTAAIAKLDPPEEIRQLRARQAALGNDLRAKRERLIAEVAEIDDALAEMGEVPALRIASAIPAVVATAGAPMLAKDSQGGIRANTRGVPGAASGTDRLAEELRELKPWWSMLSGRKRTAVALRADGTPPAQVAKTMAIDIKAASNAITQGKARLREFRAAGKPVETPASDDEAEPSAAPAVDWELLGADGTGYVGPAAGPLYPPEVITPPRSRMSVSTRAARAAKVARVDPGRCSRCGLLEPHECYPDARGFAAMRKDPGEVP